MQPAEGFPYGRAVCGPNARRPVTAVNAPAKCVVAPVFLKVSRRMRGFRTKVPSKFRSHRALPLIWAQRRKAQSFGFLNETHQNPGRTGRRRIVRGGSEQARIALGRPGQLLRVKVPEPQRVNAMDLNTPVHPRVLA